jgi:competence protein ComEC
MKRAHIHPLLASLVALGLSQGMQCPAEPAVPRAPAPPLVVYFLDVAGGEATVIATPGGRHVLIDAAGGHKGGEEVLSFLRKKGIARLDAVVMSHADSDHIGGMPTVLGSPLAIGEFLDPGYPHTTALYADVLKAVGKRAATRYRVVRAGDSVDWGRELTVRVLNPSGKPRSTNDSSIVVQLTYGKVSFLLTGDAGRKPEGQMVTRNGAALRSRILKVAHHGSKSSSIEPFLAAVRPEIAVATTSGAAADGQYKETFDRLRKAGAKVFITGRDGTVTVESDGRGYRVMTQRPPIRSGAVVRETSACTAPLRLPSAVPSVRRISTGAVSP